MNRRNFIGGLLAAAAGFTILPGAGRIWKVQRPELIVNPNWVNAPWELEVNYICMDGGLLSTMPGTPLRFVMQDGQFIEVSHDLA